MECLYGFFANISRDLVRRVVNQLRYPCSFNNFVKELKKEEDDLIALRDSVQDRVAHGKKQTLKIAEVVHIWLKDADIRLKDVNNLRNEAINKKSCCFGYCPNWISRYHFGEILANKKKELEEFNKKGGEYLNNIAQLQRVATLPSETLNFPPDKYLKFESRESTYKQVMEAVKDGEVNMIGLYGIGGCGKTTLAEEVKKIAEAQHLFDKVLFVTVSSSVEVRRIQERIASSIQYGFKVNEERERARALYDRLTKENKILVILDDVWQILDFGAIGIPLPEHHKGCKVLITTRSEDVCTSMDCQKKIHLQNLKDEEAWNLFQKQARISEDTSSTLKHLGREISDECKGLPIAIAAVAGSLKGKDEKIWKVALNKLRSSKPVNIEKGLIDPYKCLKLSYDNLDTAEAKSLFLLCSVFPEDEEIIVELLTRSAVGLGVVGEVGSYDEARSEVIAAKIKLVSSSLLMCGANDKGVEFVKMHDIVRYVAHLIAEKENKVIKCELENELTLEESSVRYLWCKEFPNDMNCSNLEFLCIITELEISNEIFKSMGKLRVLILYNAVWWQRSLSTMSFKTLTNLRCLILQGWELSDISFVRYTKKLQSLSLYECLLPSFLDLQIDDAVKQLTNLKMLELVDCEMERDNYNVIGRMPQLEELRIIDPMWDGCDQDTIEFLKTFTVSQALQRYVIKLGFWYDVHWQEANGAMMGLAKRAKVLGMANIKGGAKNMIPDIFEMKEGSMNKLTDLQISDSEEIECLVDTSNHLSEVETLFSELLHLTIIDMTNLRVLIQHPRKSLITHRAVELEELGREYRKGHQIENAQVELSQALVPTPVPFTVFQNLQKLKIKNCKKLKYVFSANTMRGLPQLKQLYIADCDQLDQIIEDIIPSAPLVNHSPEPFSLFGLERLELQSCPKLSSLFTVATAKTLISLEKLTIKDSYGLKHIVSVTYERAHENQKEYIIKNNDDLQSIISIFPSLKVVKIERCEKLEVIFPLSYLPELVTLWIRECKALKQIMEHSYLEEDKYLSKLTQLVVEKCPKLKCVHNCPKLSLTSTTTLQKLYEDFPHSDFENAQLPRWKLSNLIDQINESDEVLINSDTNKLPLLQISEESEKEHTVEVDGSAAHAPTTSTNLELDEMPSPSPFDISQDETNIELEWDPMPENTLPLHMNQQDLATSKSEPTCSLLRVQNVVGMIHKQKQIQSGALDVESYKFLALENESNRTPHFQLLEQKLSLISSPKFTELVDQESSSETGFPDQHAPEDTIDIKDILKEGTQEVFVSKGHTNKTLSTGVEGINLGNGVTTHTKSSGRDIISQGSQVAEIDDKLNESKTELGFDSSWVDEMRQHIARDPMLEEDHAQAQIIELFKRSTAANMVLDSQVVELGDGPNEHCTGTSQCQKIQDVDKSTKEESTLLIDKEGEIGVVHNDCIVTRKMKN